MIQFDQISITELYHVLTLKYSIVSQNVFSSTQLSILFLLHFTRHAQVFDTPADIGEYVPTIYFV